MGGGGGNDNNKPNLQRIHCMTNDIEICFKLWGSWKTHEKMVFVVIFQLVFVFVLLVFLLKIHLVIDMFVCKIIL